MGIIILLLLILIITGVFFKKDKDDPKSTSSKSSTSASTSYTSDSMSGIDNIDIYEDADDFTNITFSGKTKKVELGYLSVDVPEEYIVDYSEFDTRGIIHVDHPAYPDIVDRVDIEKDPDFPYEYMDEFLDEMPEIYETLTVDNQIEAAGYNLRYYKGVSDYYEEGILYQVDYYIYWKDGDVYEITFISDFKDNHIDDIELSMIFNPNGTT